MRLKTQISDIIKFVRIWVASVDDKYKNFLNTEILVDKELSYRVVFELKNCMVQIIVDEPNFAPYENIAFEALGMKDDNIDNIYFWYDNGNESVSEILFQLNKGIKFVLDFDRNCG